MAKLEEGDFKGVVRIADGCTLFHLAAKVMGSELMEEIEELLAPWQLRYGVRRGAEAAVHAAWLYLHDLDPSTALLKLDFTNALFQGCLCLSIPGVSMSLYSRGVYVSIPGVLVVEAQEAILLRSPIGEASSISSTLQNKTDTLKTMRDRLTHLSTHNAILILKRSFALLKLLHCLRTAPCFLSPGLHEYDKLLKTIVHETINVHLPEESPSWSQATLPVRLGGLGIRSAV